jgi:sodium-dependent dicarboxylate transporter 2/3/5
MGVAALAALIVILLLPLPSELVTPTGTVALSAAGKASLAVLTMAVVLWITEAIPFAVTGLLAIVMLVVTKVAPFEQLVQDGFGNPIILFFLGVLILSAVISETRLIRMSTTYLLYYARKPRTLVLIFLTVGALLSGWITDMAVAAMLTPIAVSILRDAEVRPRESNFGRTMLIACAWGPLIGGVATPAGCGPNPLTIGFLKDLAGITFTFADWMLVGFPATILMLPCGWLILLKLFPLEELDVAMSREDLQSRLREIGPLERRDILTVAIFSFTIFLWICGPFIETWTGGRVDYLSISFVAIACACLCFLPGIEVISWKRAEEIIAWHSIILVVAGMSVGMAIYKTGAAAWLACVAFDKLGSLHPVLIVFAVVFGVSLLKVMFSSNTVTGVIMVPLLIALAKNLDLDPALVAIPAGITASLAFILVTSTPTNVIPYAAGYFSIQDMAKAGLIMTVASSACVTISICVMGRLFGIITW